MFWDTTMTVFHRRARKIVLPGWTEGESYRLFLGLWCDVEVEFFIHAATKLKNGSWIYGTKERVSAIVGPKQEDILSSSVCI